MIYNYPKSQKVIAGTIFLMSDTVDSGQFSEYRIQYYMGKDIHVKVLTHDEVLNKLNDGNILRMRKQNFANYKEFLKIPINA
jgi:hypothetical protein